ncbi:MAG: peptide-methionine (S)-S-oxide reductase MsrA [Methanobacterium sp.]|nr:peptide-methionine (S)-S-oxide reductase MsrA [Methanobacterium sp.]
MVVHKYKKASFAAGCFWGVEAIFRSLKGVISTSVGYMGGIIDDPTYEDVCLGLTGHAETVEIIYDPFKISYKKLLETFWNKHDPTTKNRQGHDIGSQYRSIIFYYDNEQKKLAMESKKKLEESDKYKQSIVTEIIPKTTFYPAEDYHQQYLEKHGKRFCGV